MSELTVRVPTRADLPRWYRALPLGTGLPSWEPRPAAWHGGPEAWPQPRPRPSDEDLECCAASDAERAGFHPVAAFDGEQVVGASAMLDMEVTVPGRAAVPAGGVTATGVIATHRRRGALRGMMTLMLDQARARKQPLALLSASEGSIYGRFGFHPGTTRTRWEIERSAARLRAAEPDRGSLEIVSAEIAREAWPEVHRQVRATRVGELSPQTGRWDSLSDNGSGPTGPTHYLVHRDADGVVDGIAHYTVPWSADPAHVGRVVVDSFEALTPAAYRAMWSLLLDLDLTSTVVAPTRPRDEPLRWMLADSRAMRVTRQSDNLWVRLLDVPAALVARSYETDGELTLRIRDDRLVPDNNATWLLTVTDGHATCRHTQREPDLDIDLAALGGLYLGGMSAHDLAVAGRIRARDDAGLQCLSRMFRTDPEPHTSFGF